MGGKTETREKSEMDAREGISEEYQEEIIRKITYPFCHGRYNRGRRGSRERGCKGMENAYINNT